MENDKFNLDNQTPAQPAAPQNPDPLNTGNGAVPQTTPPPVTPPAAAPVATPAAPNPDAALEAQLQTPAPAETAAASPEGEKKPKKILIIVAVLIIIPALAYLVYALFLNKPDDTAEVKAVLEEIDEEAAPQIDLIIEPAGDNENTEQEIIEELDSIFEEVIAGDEEVEEAPKKSKKIGR